jgi:hypothetical protein
MEALVELAQPRLVTDKQTDIKCFAKCNTKVARVHHDDTTEILLDVKFMHVLMYEGKVCGIACSIECAKQAYERGM